MLKGGKLQVRRGEQVRKTEEATNIAIWDRKVAAGAANIGGLCARGACGGDDPLTAENSCQRLNGHFNIAYHQGRDVRNAIVDHNRTTIGLLQDDVLAGDLDVLERCSLGKADDL
ncbi:hypothetical protein [Bosea sp. AK1]|uniref:hypothetical protein n=1 Tax=Bosea sp. AK1 TaxID=2587160 RepID=UPI001151B0FF|nr:hypothetical protein [Bosea sp. AK1]